ncbi:hypothetical protein SAMN05443431_106164 [Olleya namhaensis]|uniref:Uncharacterized protein n=1 Tax=Olleya namhaensis TaxID=1144750 RepID=A0A1I3QJ00_9FLAO|nr:hypothetical protein SAMN05443431_106164 [Olleya namhaensis]
MIVFKTYKIQIVLLFLLTLGCSKTISEKRVAIFEDILGERQVASLNALVLDFENNLTKMYPDLSVDIAYKKYLIDLLSIQIEDPKKFEFQSNKTNKEFHESGLWDEVYRYSNLSESKDSTKILEANNIGKYMKALYKIKGDDSFITNYWNRREAAGLMPNELAVLGLINLRSDYTDYFHRRILVLEFSF